jgi:hypothetical protein
MRWLNEGRVKLNFSEVWSARSLGIALFGRKYLATVKASSATRLDNSCDCLQVENAEGGQ